MQVTQATQGDRTTLADSFRYNIFLGGHIKRFTEHAKTSADIGAGFAEHTVTAYNSRWPEMSSHEARLALFLHPFHRVVGKAKAVNEDGVELKGPDGKPVYTLDAGWDIIWMKVGNPLVVLSISGCFTSQLA